MGKSPGKWIKTVLFGKKSGRSSGSKARNASLTSDKGYSDGKGSPALAVSSPVISGPVLVSIESNGIVPELENGSTMSIEAEKLPTSQDMEKKVAVGTTSSNDLERIKEEQAAIKAQAAFRGFLARRAFHALKGIIRLQALVRGHLVRRQAVATLRSMQGIVRLQALFRGQRVRRSGIGLEVFTKFGHAHDADDVPLNNWKEKVATNAFVCKLLLSSPVAMPLQVQYDNDEANSASSWLERWTSSHSQKPLSQTKKATDTKARSTKRGSYAMETETSKPKRTVRRNSAGSVESGPTNITSEPEKPKRSIRKTPSSTTELPQEHPQTELEKVKRSLRKVSNMMAEASDRPEIEIEKPRSIKKVSNTPSVPQDVSIDESAEKAQKYISSTLEVKPDLESASKIVAVEEAVPLLDVSLIESHPLQSIDKEDNLSGTNGELSSKDEQVCQENQKGSKRRASFSAKTESADNGLQNTPPVPSYMLTTQSSKAKLRAQGSPRLITESVDRNDFTRRHSLPSSTNGKLTSHSPRTQRLVQPSSKAGIKTDRSLLSSRDGNERPIQVEWRR